MICWFVSEREWIPTPVLRRLERLEGVSHRNPFHARLLQERFCLFKMIAIALCPMEV